MWFNVAAIVLVTVACIGFTYNKRKRLTCMTGMMIAMTIGMMSSLSLGLLLGVLFKHDLTQATIGAVTFGALAGYLAGKPISLMAALDGMMAGIMGGMMGAMLGVMLLVPQTMIWFVDFLYVVITLLLIKLIEEETATSREAKHGQPSYARTFGMFGVALLVAGLLLAAKFGLFQQEQTPTTPAPESAVAPQQSEQTSGDFQTATVNVSTSGYGPQNLVLKAGVPTKINFKTQSNAGCLRQVQSESLGLDKILEAGDNYVTLQALKPGTYQYACGMGMYSSTITVK
ncbi:cupredoxin domain-containing protein [Tumebacillus sp. ITR2]|uniref:Cupredoxin domain-containing protein n=1 Tax=Tumebacillus amylolyticus TaxID=2801339 RepID=A0ABS1J5N7_9BACL|nr:cupredoxin domain-containing protein [Tumebacillus amylolyticus]MBL0385587.1 cupredoxin domain-containing protein [Tumebacillus amylolyticus]